MNSDGLDDWLKSVQATAALNAEDDGGADPLDEDMDREPPEDDLDPE